MAKTKSQYVCQQCGRVAAGSLGRCPQCGAWNSMVLEVVRPEHAPSGGAAPRSLAGPIPISEVGVDPEARLELGMAEFSRVLGGGVVPGSLILIGGDPGIGKSTLLLQMALDVAGRQRVLYVSGEESEAQIKSRAIRLSGTLAEDLFLLGETDLAAILGHMERLKPGLVIIDSIQTTQDPDMDAGAGSISQVRECTHRFQEFAKRSGVAVFLVGHVTKEGAIAGPKVMEHIVDAVLYLEGDSHHSFRLLRSVKNRFGATTEVGVFEMGSEGMTEVANPSEVFLAERLGSAPGSAIAITMEGTRPLLVEVQGLTSKSAFGHPRRTANGVDFNRLLLTIAVLSRRAGVQLADQDVFINVVGGLRITEPALDLAMAVALSSSHRDRPVPADLAFVGEIGLSGELRAVPRLEARLHEARKLGFRRVVIPKMAKPVSYDQGGFEVFPHRTVGEVLRFISA